MKSANIKIITLQSRNKNEKKKKNLEKNQENDG